MTFASQAGLLAATIGQVLFFSSTGFAQATSNLPAAEYYVAKGLFGSGRIPAAAEGFETALKRARQVGDQRWMDSIPPLVMLGECYYQQGSLAAALEHYDNALMLALAYPGWIDQIDVPPEQLPPLEKIPKGIDWFVKSQASQPVSIPEAVQFVIDPTRAQADGQGGLVAPVGLVTRLDATEVLRTMGLAMLRRQQILGPLSSQSPLTDPLLELFRREPKQPVLWVQGSWRVLRGISQLASANAQIAPATLRAGVLLGNRLDYFMSPMALLALAETEARAGNFKAAITALQDASLLAAQYEQHGELEQSLRLLGSYAAGTGRIDLLEPLQQAGVWSASRSGSSAAAALIGAAELAVTAGDLPKAERLCTQASTGLRSPEIDLLRSEAHLSYVKAMLGFAQDRSALGVSNLDTALQQMRGTAQTGAVVPVVFQAQTVLNLLAAGNLTAADAEQALDEILREPGPWQWQTDPLGTLAGMTTSSLPAYERHLELAAARQDRAAVLSRMDRLQRQSLYEALPLGGRLLGWRDALSGPANGLAPGVQPILNAALPRTPELKRAQERVLEISNELRQGPLPLDERQLPSDSKKRFAELQTQSQLLENALALQALMRNPLPRVLPPPLASDDLGPLLQAQDAVIALAVAGQSIHGVLATPNHFESWHIADAGPVLAKLQQLQLDLGLVRQANKPIVDAGAPNAKWQTTVTELRDLLFPTTVQDVATQAKRVILIPNQRLWYVPFELLPMGSSNLPWLSTQQLLYVPTLGSLTRAFQQQTPLDRTLGVYGSLFSIDLEVNDELAQQVIDAVPNSSSLDLTQKITAAAPAWLKLCTDQLWTAYLIEKSGWDSVLMSFGKSKQTTFGNLLETPRIAPQSIVLAGLNTTLRSENLGNGNELFLPACSILFGGGQTAVLTRWPVGGRSSSDILRRYLEERATTSSSVALRRAILAHWPESYLVAEEPVLLPSRRDAPPLTTGAHPLIWASYMAIGDTLPAAP